MSDRLCRQSFLADRVWRLSREAGPEDSVKILKVFDVSIRFHTCNKAFSVRTRSIMPWAAPKEIGW